MGDRRAGSRLNSPRKDQPSSPGGLPDLEVRCRQPWNPVAHTHSAAGLPLWFYTLLIKSMMTLGCGTSTEWTINWGKLPVVSLWAISFSQMVSSSRKRLSHYGLLVARHGWVARRAKVRGLQVQLGTQQAQLLIRCHWLMLLWLDYASGVSSTVFAISRQRVCS